MREYGINMGLLAVIACVIGGLIVHDASLAAGQIDVDAASLPHIERADLILSPQQAAIDTVSIDLGHGASANLKHTYDISGVVVTARAHLKGGLTDISPLDLGIAWGPMAQAEVLAAGRYTAGYRYLKWSVPTDMVPLDVQKVHISNTHVLPASNDVRDVLMDMEPGQSVRLTGFLVDVFQPGFSPWRSSTTRDDGFPAGCEIMLVIQAEVTRG